MKHTLWFVPWAFSVGLTAPCLADDNPELPAALLACGQIPDATQRAHCYDTQIAALKKKSASAPAAAIAATRPAAPVPQVSASPKRASVAAAQPAQSQFGAELLPAPARPAPANDANVMLSSITSVRSVGPQMWLISLANGQIWRQDGTQITAFFRAGDSIRIDRGALGSYHLSAGRLGAKNWVQVVRVR